MKLRFDQSGRNALLATVGLSVVLAGVVRIEPKLQEKVEQPTKPMSLELIDRQSQLAEIEQKLKDIKEYRSQKGPIVELL